MTTPARDQEKLTEFFRVIDALALYTAPALCSIIGVDAVDYGELVGTGTYLRYGDRLYILTARHVAEEACSKYPGCAFSVGAGKRPILITRPFVLHKEPFLDIAVLPVDEQDIVGTSVVPFAPSVLAESSADLEDYLFIHGYPGAKSRFSALGQGIVSSTQPYGTVTGTSVWAGFDDKIHFALEYPGEGQEHSDGRAATLPDPHGLSGTAVWRTGRAKAGANWTPQDAKIVGIVHRWDQDSSTLVATRIEPVLEFLRCVEADKA